MPAPQQPIVILGGFLITQEAYQPMRQTLADLSGLPLERVELVAVGRLEWLLTVWPFAWARILDRVALAVERQARLSPSGRVTVVGHSSGGIMLRLFLDDQPFEGRRWNGRARVDTLVMLGSPHTALKATPLRQRVARQLPGCPFAPAAYRNSSGDAHDRGDGLVPVSSALLEGSQSVVLEGVAHGGAFGPRWYGTPQVVERWWPVVAAPAGAAAPQSPSSAPM